MKILTDTKFLVACLIGGFAAGCCIATAWQSTTDKSFWDIASAVGTIGAAVVALGIALSQGATVRSRERAHAVLAAARLSGAVTTTATAITGIHSVCIFSRGWTAAEFFESIKEKAQQAPTIATTDLMPLLALPNHCANRIANALGLIDMIRSDVIRIGDGERWMRMNEFAKAIYFSSWKERATEASALIFAAQRDFDATVASEIAVPIFERIDDLEQ